VAARLRWNKIVSRLALAALTLTSPLTLPLSQSQKTIRQRMGVQKSVNLALPTSSLHPRLRPPLKQRWMTVQQPPQMSSQLHRMPLLSPIQQPPRTPRFKKRSQLQTQPRNLMLLAARKAALQASRQLPAKVWQQRVLKALPSSRPAVRTLPLLRTALARSRLQRVTPPLERAPVSSQPPRATPLLQTVRQLSSSRPLRVILLLQTARQLISSWAMTVMPQLLRELTRTSSQHLRKLLQLPRGRRQPATSQLWRMLTVATRVRRQRPTSRSPRKTPTPRTALKTQPLQMPQPATLMAAAAMPLPLVAGSALRLQTLATLLIKQRDPAMRLPMNNLQLTSVQTPLPPTPVALLNPRRGMAASLRMALQRRALAASQPIVWLPRLAQEILAQTLQQPSQARVKLLTLQQLSRLRVSLLTGRLRARWQWQRVGTARKLRRTLSSSRLSLLLVRLCTSCAKCFHTLNIVYCTIQQ
jgi:hypothetical protein